MNPTMRKTLAGIHHEIAPFRGVIALSSILASTWAVWIGGISWLTPALVCAALTWSALGVIDARSHRIPDVISLPGLVATVVLLIGAGLATESYGDVVRALVAAAAMGLCYLVLFAIHPRGLGFGDVKLSLHLGLVAGWFGWSSWIGALLLAFLIGGVLALALLVTRRGALTDSIAFGPAMICGAMLSITGGALGAIG